VLKGEAPAEGRAGANMPPADLEAVRETVSEILDRPATDNDIASYNMYPKVFTDFAAAQDLYGPTSVLPTLVYFYGLEVATEIFVEIEKGKTLVIRCLAFGDVNEKGMVRVFFELNGQPRSIAVPDRLHGAAGAAVRAKAEIGDKTQIGAPMPGVVSTVNVKSGQSVSAGDVLLSIEAMKMETAIYSEMDGVVEELLVKAGDQIDAKDLLARLSEG